MSRGLFKTAVVVLPFLLVFLGIRSCAGGEAERWRAQVAETDPAAKIAVNEEGLIVIAPGVSEGREVSVDVLAFRQMLIRDYADLVGEGRDQRMVVVLFSTLEQLQDHADRKNRFGGGKTTLHGYTDGRKGAIFLPPGSSRGTLRHETVHLVMFQSYGHTVRFSPWLKEGLAQLFEPREPGLDDHSRSALPELLPRDTIDVNRLLTLDDYERFTGAGAIQNYLEAAVLTAFLFEQRPRELLVRYVERERQTEAHRLEAFRRIYHHDEEPFRRDLQAYIRRQKTARQFR
ncbi:MAG: DUF1570 domain-containing protein [Planctomycetota bacterium]|jgi:hypothetical protein